MESPFGGMRRAAKRPGGDRGSAVVVLFIRAVIWIIFLGIAGRVYWLDMADRPGGWVEDERAKLSRTLDLIAAFALTLAADRLVSLFGVDLYRTRESN